MALLLAAWKSETPTQAKPGDLPFPLTGRISKGFVSRTPPRLGATAPPSPIQGVVGPVGNGVQQECQKLDFHELFTVEKNRQNRNVLEMDFEHPKRYSSIGGPRETGFGPKFETFGLKNADVRLPGPRMSWIFQMFPHVARSKRLGPK